MNTRTHTQAHTHIPHFPSFPTHLRVDNLAGLSTLLHQGGENENPTSSPVINLLYDKMTQKCTEETVRMDGCVRVLPPLLVEQSSQLSEVNCLCRR